MFVLCFCLYVTFRHFGGNLTHFCLLSHSNQVYGLDRSAMFQYAEPNLLHLRQGMLWDFEFDRDFWLFYYCSCLQSVCQWKQTTISSQAWFLNFEQNKAFSCLPVTLSCPPYQPWINTYLTFCPLACNNCPPINLLSSSLRTPSLNRREFLTLFDPVLWLRELVSQVFNYL